MEFLYLNTQLPHLATEIRSILTPSILKEMYLHAYRCYPEECCGLVLQKGLKVCQNMQNKWHTLDPIHYPRTAQEAFLLSAEDSLFLSRNIESENSVKILYHSHVNVGAYLSEEDRQNALFEGKPIYPIDHFVIDIRQEQVVEAKLFRFREDNYQLIATLSGLKLSESFRNSSEKK